MISPPVTCDHCEAPAPYHADAGSQPGVFSWAALYALDTACSLLGCRHAWVASHAAGGCQIVLRREQTMEISPGLQELILRQAAASHERVVTVPWAGSVLLFLGLSSGLAADGRKYVLGMQLDQGFEMTERRAGVLDGLRCSLQTYLARLRPAAPPQPAAPQSLEMAGPGAHPVTCSCCRRVHTAQHGWMHWDDLRLMTTGRGSSHTVCEKCADVLYSDVLNNGL